VRTKARDDTTCHHFKDSPQRVPGFTTRIYKIDHASLGVAIRTTQWCVVGNSVYFLPRQLERRIWNSTELGYVTAKLNAELSQ